MPSFSSVAASGASKSRWPLVPATLLLVSCTLYAESADGPKSDLPVSPIEGGWRYTLLNQCPDVGTSCGPGLWEECVGGTVHLGTSNNDEHGIYFGGYAECLGVRSIVSGMTRADGYLYVSVAGNPFHGTYDGARLDGIGSHLASTTLVFRADRLRENNKPGALEITTSLNGSEVVDTDPLRRVCEFLGEGKHPLLAIDGLGSVPKMADSAGRIVLGGILPGTHRISARCGCWTTTLAEATAQVEVLGDGSTSPVALAFSGEPAVGAVAVRWDPANCLSQDQTVRVSADGPSCRSETVPCAAGHAGFQGLAAGTYIVSLFSSYGGWVADYC
ncbi:MAG TPA: hypothetical protein VFP10_10670, partial [Candidatus Eisenbacteria bacterium]|nr:hypothetical protein [Candidatus Eisenbacteria bacterium]